MATLERHDQHLVTQEHVAKVVGPTPSTAELAAAGEGLDVDSDGDPLLSMGTNRFGAPGSR